MFNIRTAAVPHALAYGDAGRYFVANNATPGTGVATIAAQATLTDTSPFIAIHSGTTLGVMVDYVLLLCTAPGTGGTAVRFAVKTDNAKAAPTGGTALNVACVNQGGNATPSASVFAGPLVAAAATGAVRLQSHRLLRPVIPVPGDTFLFNFGEVDFTPAEGLVTSGAAITSVSYGMAPCFIGPNQVIQFHLWLPSQSVASSWEYEVGFIEA